MTGVAEREAVRDADARRSLGRPALCVVTMRGTGDGIAYVARLVERVLRDALATPPRLLALEPARSGHVSRLERARFGARLLAAQATGRADWLLFNHVGIARAQRSVPAALRKPYGLMLMGIEAWDPELPADRLAAMREARIRIAISNHTARRVMETHPGVGPVMPCLLSLMPDDAPHSGDVDEALLAQVRPRSALIVGRMSASERYKGHDELLESWPSVLARVPDAQLVVAGRGDDVERLRTLAGTLGIAEHVLFAGFVSDATLDRLLSRVAAFAMPSRGEGFGLVYLEAMKRGVPCLGSVHDAATDIIVHDRTGTLVDQDDRAALADGVAALLADRARARALGAAGRARYEQLFTYERYRERLLALLTGAFGAGGR